MCVCVCVCLCMYECVTEAERAGREREGLIYPSLCQNTNRFGWENMLLFPPEFQRTTIKDICVEKGGSSLFDLCRMFLQDTPSMWAQSCSSVCFYVRLRCDC